HLFVGGEAFHHQRDPLAELLLVLRIFHAVPAMMRANRREGFLRKATFSGPCTKLMCGTGWMNDRGSAIAPFLTKSDQSCRDKSNSTFTSYPLQLSMLA